uniref:C-type cytochrome n=1 Tax=Eiseniibacteriota bacterium TaxID=2212470 RepID=A0A832MLW7_UNCEI
MNKQPEQDRLLDHNYDGIQEYDNPMPGWWVWIFWATIAFSVLYWFNVPGIGPGPGRIANYEREMAAAEEKYGALRQAGPVDEAALRALAADPAQVEAGRAVWSANCAVCHREDGGGGIGPNLTDAFWLHGGSLLAIHRTVQAGVLDKGMPAWGEVLRPDDLNAVVAFVATLRGTHPPDPKAPEGTPVDSTAAP